MLSKKFNVDYDDAGSIGKRYRRQDEIGTPFCVTYDFESEEDGCVTVRDRDSMEQERINITKRIDQALDKIEKKAKWSALLCFALITIGLWTALCTTFERHVGYKLIIVSALALAFMVKSTIDLLNVAKLKKTASRRQNTT